MLADSRHSLLPAMLLPAGLAFLGALLETTLHPMHGRRNAVSA